MKDKDFYLKLRKLLDTWKPDWKEDWDDRKVAFDDKWVSIRTPYFFDEDPIKWDGYPPFTNDIKNEDLENTTV